MVNSPLQSLWREAVQSFRSGRFLTIGVVMMAGSLTALALVGETLSADRARAADERFRRLGGYLRIIEENAEEPRSVLSRPVCDGLGRLPGVEASGSIGEQFSRPLSALGDRELQLFPASPGIRSVLGAIGIQDAGQGLIMADDLAESLGFGELTSILLSEEGSAVHVDIVAADLEPIRAGYDRGAFVIVPPVDQATTCIVAMEPASVGLADSLPAAFGATDVVAVPALIGGGLATSGEELWNQRATKNLWLVGALGFALVLAIAGWARRSENGLYRVLGLQQGEISMIRLIETSISSATGSMLGATVATGALWSGYSQALPFGWAASGLTLLGQLISCWFFSIAPWGSSPIDQLKDR